MNVSMSSPLPDLLFARSWLLLFIPVVPLILWFTARSRVRQRRFSRISVILRSLVLVLLLASLAGPMIARQSQAVTTIFAIDRSNSIQSVSGDAANQWIAEALENAGDNQGAAIVAFGGQPDLPVPPIGASAIDTAWTQSDANIDPGATDISSALALARSLPVGEARRIVLLSDGAENSGNALEQADQAAADGVPIDVVSLAGINPADLRIEDLSGPSALWQGDPLSVLVTLSVGAGGPVQVTLSIDGQIASTQELTLPAGTTSYTLTNAPLAAGYHAIDVQVAGSSDIDRIAENNGRALGLVVRERPRVLLVATDGADTTRIVSALESQGADVQVVASDAVPSTESELATSNFQAIVLDNVPAWTLDEAQQTALVDHTRNGGGLIAIGGSASFGPGSYAGTTLERALPVTVKVVDGRQRPKVAVLIVMDTSGSMNYDPSTGGTSKIELAKEGVLTAASALTTGDQIGVIAFNDEPSWALPMSTLTGDGDSDRIHAVIDPLAANGGTEIYPALRLAYDSLRNVDADVRHIILLSDGRSQTGTRETYDRLVTENGNDRITLSAVALGSDSDVDLLQDLATNGGGRYHYVQKPEDIPTITFQEAQSAGSQSVIRGSFTPIQQQPSTILSGIDPSTLPAVEGYDFTAARPNAQVVLTSDRGDPLLTKWQLGLGRVVAWTGDDGSDFANQWANWDGYESFWGNAVRWTLPDPENQRPGVAVTRDGNDAIFTIDLASAGVSPDLANQSVIVTAPGGDQLDVSMISAGPDRYETRLKDASPGAYALTMPGDVGTLGTAVDPSPEWQAATGGNDLLQMIATRTDGTVRSLDDIPGGDIFASVSGGTNVPMSVDGIWQYTLIAALIAYLFDIALRLGFTFSLPFPRKGNARSHGDS